MSIDVFRAGGKGGQHQNKTSTGVRLTHGPTGIRVEARSERSQTANKNAAFVHLQAKLDRMLDDRDRAARQRDHEAKPESCFGSQIRTVRLVGSNQGVTDHRTGEFHPSVADYLGGRIDRFLRRS